MSRLPSMCIEGSDARNVSILVAVHYIEPSSSYMSNIRVVICPIVTRCCFFFGHVGRSCRKMFIQVRRGRGEQACNFGVVFRLKSADQLEQRPCRTILIFHHSYITTYCSFSRNGSRTDQYIGAFTIIYSVLNMS